MALDGFAHICCNFCGLTIIYCRTSFAIWMLMNLMLIVVPRYGAVLMTTCGFLLIATCCGYFGMLPEVPLVVSIEGNRLDFHFGWCYWLVLIAGFCQMLFYHNSNIITTILRHGNYITKKFVLRLSTSWPNHILFKNQTQIV